MRNTITKTVSMMLVTVMVLGIAVMPMRAYADLVNDAINKIPDPTWRFVVNATWEIAKVMLQSPTTSEVESAVSQFSAYFEPTLSDSFYYVTAEQMNQLSTQLAQNGIGVYPTGVPGRELIALALQDNTVQTATGTVTLDADVGDYYTYSGKTVVRVGVDGAAGEDFDSYTGTTSTDTTVGITPEGGLVDIPVTGKGSGATVSGATINFNSNNWQVKNENGTYVDIADFYYNPITQTYDITTVDNRHYTYQFYYDYTYITYIGSSAEYREAYKVYYELPDGRSSGDLTADELKGLSLQFDMVNYDKAASDILTRILLPFDGDFDSTAFYSSTSSLTATAPYSFLESPEPFGGSLYIGSSSSTWTFSSMLAEPLSQGNGDGVTLQGRFYINEAGNSNCFFYVMGDFWLPVVYHSYNDDGDETRFAAIAKNPVGGFYVGVQNGSLMVLSSNINGNYYFEDTLNDVLPSSYYSQVIASGLSPGVWYEFAISLDVSSFSPSPVKWYDYSSNTLYFIPGTENKYNISSTINNYYNPYSCSVYVYLNGSKVGSFGVDSPFSGNFGTNFVGSSTGKVMSGQQFSYQRTSFICSSVTGFQIQCRDVNQSPLEFDNFRLVSTPLFSTDSYTVPQAPFDTNLVYVLPSVADLNDNTVAIMSQLPVSGYRVGGIRPTDPTLASGYVYMHIDGEYIDSVQQWNGAYWEEVTARLYTGIRWIPVTAFNVFTLEDMFDIIDPDADGSGDNVDDIYKYYLWWSGEWGSFQQWLQGTMQTLIEAIQASGGGGGGSDAPVVIVPGYNDQTTTSEITTENPDGSTTKTTIVSNAAGLVYSNSVTTYPTDANGNTKTITVYTDSSGVMYQTETTIDRDGNVTVTEPTKATGTLGSILKMITNGVMSIAGTVIEGFVTIVVDGVKFIIESADSLIDGVGNMITSLASSITDFAGTVQDNLDQPGVNPSADGDDDVQGDGDGGQTYNMFDVFFEVLPPEIVTALTLCFVAMIALPIINKMHF